MHGLYCLVLSFVAVSGLCIQSSSVETEWKLWKQKFNKFYKKQEEKIRKDIWLDHYKTYERHNQDLGREYEMEMSEFADQVLPRNLKGHVRQTAGDDHSTGRDLQFVPSSWDWRKHGVVTPVKNQGQSPGVAAIVATESVESYTAIQNGTLTSLSYFETAQCCLSMPILSADVFKCIHNIGGLCSAENYPKTAGTCKNDSCTAVGTVNGGKQIPQGDEDTLKAVVYSVPVMAGIDASHVSFQLYRSGVYSEPECKDVQIDHAVQIVGYGSVNGQDYWICKNSWGVNWGMGGYVMIARNKDNMCGIATSAFYPV